MSTSPPESKGPSKVAAGRTRQRGFCFNYRSSKGCTKGDTCPFIHADPKPTKDKVPPVSQPRTPPTPAEGAVAGTSGSPREPSGDQPKRDSDRGPNRNWKGRRRAPLSPEEVKQQALAQSAAARAQNAKKLTIYAEDEEQTWTLDRNFLAEHSRLLGLVLSYSGKQADLGIRDPIKDLRGLIRFGDGAGSLQLDDVKADDFDIFLEALRATAKTEPTIEELKIILALASDWGFQNLQNRTIRSIEKFHLSPIDRAVLARRCKIAKWIQRALLSLTILPDSFTASEIHILGATTSSAIWRAREAILHHYLQVILAEDPSARQTHCHDTCCTNILRQTLVRVLEKPGSAGKAEADVAALVEKEIYPDEKVDLCDMCASDTGSAARRILEEVQVAKAVLEDSLGNEDVTWLEPA